MTDRLEHDLTALFAERTASTTYPPVPPELRDLSERPRRRRWPAAPVAAAAVVLVVAGTGLGGALSGGGSEPAAPPEPSVTDTAAPRIPYVHDGVLHVGDAEVSTTADQLRTAGDTVLLTDVSSDSGREVSTSWVLRGDALVQLPYLDDAQPALSTDGSRAVALSHPDRSTTRLRVHDLADGDVVGTLDLPVAGACCWSGAIQVQGFEPGGRVVYADDGFSYVWDPTEPSPLLVTGSPGPVVQTSRQGVLVGVGRYGTGERRFLGELTGAGDFVEELALRMPESTEPAVWSPDGKALVAFTTDAGAVIRPLDGGERVVLELGDRVRRSYAGWESDDAVLLVASRGPTYELLRCGLDGGCDVVADMGGVEELENWVFPAP